MEIYLHDTHLCEVFLVPWVNPHKAMYCIIHLTIRYSAIRSNAQDPNERRKAIHEIVPIRLGQERHFRSFHFLSTPIRTSLSLSLSPSLSLTHVFSFFSQVSGASFCLTVNIEVTMTMK